MQLPELQELDPLIQKLLEAGLYEPPRALASWRALLEKHKLETSDAAMIALLPLVYRNLKEQSHPFCKSAYRHTWMCNQLLLDQTMPTLEKLFEVGVEKVVLLKGMALILHHYRDRGARRIGDWAIFIDPKRVPLAFATLTASGWNCSPSALNPQDPNHLQRWHAANFSHSAGLNLELHWSLFPDSNREIDQAVLDAAPPGIHPASPTHLLFQTCIHAFKYSHKPFARWIQDALTLLKSPIDFPHLSKLAQSAHVAQPLIAALTHLADRFGAPIPPLQIKPSRLEKLESRAKLRSRPQLASFYRSCMRRQPLRSHLQSLATLASSWLMRQLRSSQSLQYGIDAKREGRIPIDKLCIFGERCSGTNYAQQLVNANFPSLEWKQDFGWKHFPAWLSAPASLDQGKSHHYTFENSDSYLFIVVFRNPYDWLKSLWKQPYYASPHLVKIPLETFVRSPWMTVEAEPHINAMDKNPETGTYFANVLQMRTAKIRNMLQIKNKVKNIYYVKYETLRDHPEQVVDELARLFHIKRKADFYPINNYCDPIHNGQLAFVKSEPFDPPPDLLPFIHSQLDLPLERSIGYIYRFA